MSEQKVHELETKAHTQRTPCSPLGIMGTGYDPKFSWLPGMVDGGDTPNSVPLTLVRLCPQQPGNVLIYSSIFFKEPWVSINNQCIRHQRQSSHCSSVATCMRMQVRSLASLSGLRIQRCQELWCRSQMRLRSGVAMAVAQASSCSSNQTPGLRTFICQGCGPQKKKRKKKKNRASESINLTEK